MTNTECILITQSTDVTAVVNNVLDGGDPVFTSDPTHNGFQTFRVQDPTIESWLRDDVAKSHDELMADPCIGIPADQIMARLRAAYLENKIKS